MAAVRVIARIVSRPEKLTDFRKIALALAEQSRREHGCRAYEVLQDTRDPHVFFLVEEWESTEALDEHNTSSHVREILAKAPSYLAEAPEIRRCTAIG
jgi:quinol monooxygenase YgiN